MSPTRRQFIRQFGIMLASLIASGCAPSCPDAVPGSGDRSPRERLRSCWLGLEGLRGRDWGEWEGMQERLWQATDQFLYDHQEALDDLIAAGELSEDAAGQVQAAYEAVAWHVRDDVYRELITCYLPTITPPLPTTASEAAERQIGIYAGGSPARLLQQTDLLVEMAGGGDLDQETVARVQAAVERDIAILTLSSEEKRVLLDELVEAVGDSYDYPPFSELDLEITPEDAEAARFLVELLLEKPE